MRVRFNLGYETAIELAQEESNYEVFISLDWPMIEWYMHKGRWHWITDARRHPLGMKFKAIKFEDISKHSKWGLRKKDITRLKAKLDRVP